LGESSVLINRKPDGTLELRDDLVFHGGKGATLEMREFGMTELRAKLLAAGFREVDFLTENLPDIGILFDHDVSQPLIARKEPFVMDRCARSQMIQEWHAALDEGRTARDQIAQERERTKALADQVRAASESRWLRLGRRFGLGPDFNK
jgi:hypothetical protein